MSSRIVDSVTLVVFSALISGCSGSGIAGNALPANRAADLRGAGERVSIQDFADLPKYGPYYSPAAITRLAGSLWVADDIDQDYGECVIAQIATNGKRTQAFYYMGLSSQGASFQDLAAGPDGALWITDYYNEQILRLTTSGTYTGFPLPDYSAPNSIVLGPDKALWFTLQSATRGAGIGRITTSGTLHIFSAPGFTIDIAAGADGALWFTEPNKDRIGRITTRGKVTQYSSGITPAAQPYSIAAGPDGALWFTERSGGRIGRITTAGKVTEFSSGITAGEQPFDIAAGPDGAMWFTEYQTYGSYRVKASKIGRITTSGAITEYSKNLASSSTPTAITRGPDGNMWFDESGSDLTGRVTL